MRGGRDDGPGSANRPSAEDRPLENDGLCHKEIPMMRVALGWTILHSLWQGAVAALALAAALSVIRSSRIRYGAACLAMLGILAGFGLTLSRTIRDGSVTTVKMTPRLPTAPLDAAERAHRVPPRFSAANVAPWLTPFWMAGVVLFHLHSLASWIAARRMLRRGVCSPPDTWQERFVKLRERMRIPAPVTLLESCLADVPVVIGYLRPVVLVPVGMLAGMPAAQIDAILLHELAHVWRRDYLVNVLQTVVEGFLFYHPAVWWISGVIRAERENCCDDLVVSTSGDAHSYAAALAALEQTRWSAHEAALAVTGGNLMKRIRRLLNPLDAPRTALSPVLSAAILTITATLALTAWQTNTTPPELKGAYKGWLEEDVVYIITDQERTAFKALETNDERRMFIRQFWERRDPTPGTPRNEFQEEHYRRIGYANQNYATNDVPGWKTDRGRIYIIYGPPDEIETHPAGGTLEGHYVSYPFEQWLYHHIANIGDNVFMDFVDPDSKGTYRMTSDPH
jgi:GWxTD domain-containing protein